MEQTLKTIKNNEKKPKKCCILYNQKKPKKNNFTNFLKN